MRLWSVSPVNTRLLLNDYCNLPNKQSATSGVNYANYVASTQTPGKFRQWNEQLWTENRHLQAVLQGSASAANGIFSDLEEEEDSADGSLQKSQGMLHFGSLVIEVKAL